MNMGAPKTLGGITKFIKSYEEYHFSKTSCKGGGQPYFTVLNPKFHPSSPPPSPLRVPYRNISPINEIVIPRAHQAALSLPGLPTK